MDMRQMAKTLAGAMFGVTLFTATAAVAGPYADREIRQQNRISQGITSGSLTPAETARLEREEARIEAERRAFWADGRLTPWERGKLTHDLNKASRDISRLKHNGRH